MKTNPESQSFRRLMGYAMAYKGRLMLGVFFGIITGGSVAGLLIVLEKVLGNVFSPDATPWNRVVLIAIMLPVIALIKSVAQFTSVYLVAWVGFRVVTDLREKTFTHLQDLSLSFYARNRPGELISRITNDTAQVQSAVSNVVADIVRQPFILVGALGYLLYRYLELALVSVVVFPLCILPVILLGKKIHKYSRQQQQHLAGLVSIIQENISGAQVVKGYSMEQYETRKFKKENDRVFSRLLRITAARGATTPLMEVVSMIGLSIALLYVRSKGMPGEQFFTFAASMVFMYDPAKRLSRVHLAIRQASASSDRIFEILDEPIDVSHNSTGRLLEGPIDTIEFENVSFSYGEEPILRGVNLKVKAGQVLAIVGPTGAGKSTLVGLVPRFYDVTEGRVLINGIDVKEYNLSALRKACGIVTQDTFLFNDTITCNITAGQPEPNLDQSVRAAQKAHAHDFISAREEGYNREVGDRGGNLSGGERQRVSIARAFYKDAPILILDEATSSLDNEVERLVQAGIDELMEGRTVFAIAHRLSTIQHADRILVLDKGQIVEEGTHDQLIALGGKYKHLHDIAFKG
jgi:ATP-binding cassette, subfamily B, bacterial MsbA